MSMKYSVEAECGYTLRVEGTSVEYVLARPGGKFNKKSTYPRIIITLVRTLYLPEKMPHHSETSAAEYPCIVAMFLNNH